MSQSHPRIQQLVKAIDFEEQEEKRRYVGQDIKSLKSAGLLLQPIQISRRYFGFADYPEAQFRLLFPADTSQFRDGTAIEIFYRDEEPIKGILLSLQGKAGEVRFLAPDFPDWIDEQGVGIRRSSDTRTVQFMKDSLKNLTSNEPLFSLFEQLHGDSPITRATNSPEATISFLNRRINPSQQLAVQKILNAGDIFIVHGPPGTGKTTTLIEAIVQLKLRGHQVLVAAPSNAAVDHMTRGLLAAGVKAVRVGNSVKIADDLFSATPEGRLNDKNIQKEIKALKIRAEEFRKMALQYKRRFGKAEREQRNLLFAEVKSIRQEIRKTMDYHLDKIFSNAEVILGTPLALAEQRFKPQQFHTLFIDEAAQCLEPLAWGIMPLAKHTVLAGDHFQLPPTVLSQKATQLGLNISILETAIRNIEDQVLLDTQYRMRTVIAGFSNDYFYQGALQTPDHLNNESVHMTFIDTAGTGMEEEAGQEGTSLVNRGELDLVQKIILSEKLNPEAIAFISPYAAQVSLANEVLPKIARISTIDSFQGQEFHTVFISLVRSNEQGQIGFLDDVRRMNVALTRAQEKLYVIGDSATLGQHSFYKKYLEYVEKAGHYISAWEWMYD